VTKAAFGIEREDAYFTTKAAFGIERADASCTFVFKASEKNQASSLLTIW
jgi:hypothetical protein